MSAQIEHRYIVLKLTDIERAAAVRPSLIEDLADLCSMVNAERYRRGAGELESVVIEKDWPEYAPTVRELLARVDGVYEDGWPVGNQVERAKRILAAVDEYHERPNGTTRNILRARVMNELEGAADAV